MLQLKGIDFNCNMFIFCLFPPGPGHYFDVRVEVFDVAPKWRGFGEALHLSLILLKYIEGDHKFDTDACLHRVLFEYLKKNYDYDEHGNPSWRKIVEAISDRTGGDNNALALRVAYHHSMAIA